MTNRKLLLSLDIGTSALKVGLFDIEGNLLAVETREQTCVYPRNNWVEQDPNDTWRLIVDAINELNKKHGSQNVSAITLTVQRGSVIALDQFGKPLSNLIVWMDQRGRKYVDYVNQIIGKKRYYTTAGHSLSHITGASKVLWFHSEGNEVWDNAAVIGSPQTYFLSKLGCDELVCDQSSGTYHFPLNIDVKQWSKEIASDLNFPLEKLPKIVVGTDIVGYLSTSVAAELGLKAGIPIIAGGGDGQCAAVGCGAIVKDVCMINIGTGAGIQFFLDQPRRNPDMVFTCSGHVVSDGWETEGHTQASGAVFKWFRDEFGLIELKQKNNNHEISDFDYLVDEAMQAEAGANGLIFLPTFNGITAPFYDPHARGCLLGLSLVHKRSHIIRAILEGITLEIKWIMESMMESGIRANEIRLVGGGSKNRHWNQIHADILGYPIYTVENPDAALVGAAMCAAVGLGEYPDLYSASKKFVTIKDEYYPQEGNRDTYRYLYSNYKNAYSILSKSGFFSEIKKQI